jgi:hypothetical protein
VKGAWKNPAVDIDEELGSLREWDAAVLAGLHLTPDQPRAAGHALRHALLLRFSGIRGAMKRLERRGYLEPGWSVDYIGAHCQVTDLGERVAAAAARCSWRGATRMTRVGR